MLKRGILRGHRPRLQPEFRYNAAHQFLGVIAMKRSRHLASFIFGVALAATLGAAQAPRSGADRCAGSRDLRLINGRIVTMDKRNTTVSEVTIQDGRFESVGRG